MCNIWVRFGRTEDAWNGCERSENMNSKKVGGSNATCKNRGKVDGCNGTWLWRKNKWRANGVGVGMSQSLCAEIQKTICIWRNMCGCDATAWCWNRMLDVEKVDGMQLYVIWRKQLSIFPISRWTGVPQLTSVKVSIKFCIRGKLCVWDATFMWWNRLFDKISMCVYGLL